MQTTTQVRDDVYDIPERNAPVLASNGEPAPSANGLPDGFVEDYYDPNDSGKYDLGYANDRSYHDITYNDPQYYNYDRFGFNTGSGVWGSSFGMGMNQGWPGMNGGMWGNPYWNNSYMSGYGAWGSPWYGSGWNMGGSMFWGQPYGGFPSYYGGYYPYGGFYPYGMYPPFGPAFCYGNGSYYGNAGVYQHRPTLGGGGGTVGAPVPVRYRPNTLISTRPNMTNEVRQATRTVTDQGRSTGTRELTQGQRSEGSRNGGTLQRSMPSGESRSGGSPGGGGGGGSRPSTGGGRR
jgi:hypothetical protein